MQNSGKKRIKWWILLAAVILAWGLTACAPKKPEPVSETELLLNTVVTVTLYGGGDEEYSDIGSTEVWFGSDIKAVRIFFI